MIALAPKEANLPHLGLEIGGASKSVRSAFSKMRSGQNFPGMVLLVVRELKRKNRLCLRWHFTDGEPGHDSFELALAAREEAG